MTINIEIIMDRLRTLDGLPPVDDSSRNEELQFLFCSTKGGLETLDHERGLSGGLAIG